jgi:CheY-like chemotaxis protein/DNA-binding MarR family transcriptional regulator
MASVETVATDAIDVLVVDDDLEATEELVEYLTKAGLACRSADDGWAALNLLADGCRPRVVVSDLRMPELDGLQFVEHLRQQTDLEDPDIVFVSGDAGFADAVRALQLGARDMLTKPIDGPRLVRAVKSALVARQMRQPGEPEAATPPLRAPVTERKRVALGDMRAIRKAREQYFPAELFSDPCWEMLLDLYDAQLTEAEVTVTSLGAASGVPLTTAMRRMETLKDYGFIERLTDPGDKRRTVVRLTEAGLSAIDKFFENYWQRRS